MQGVHTEEVGGWPCGGGRAFLLPKNGWRVVVQCCHCRFGDVPVCCDDIWVDNRRGKFQVAIGDGSMRVCSGY